MIGEKQNPAGNGPAGLLLSATQSDGCESSCCILFAIVQCGFKIVIAVQRLCAAIGHHGNRYGINEIHVIVLVKAIEQRLPIVFTIHGSCGAIRKQYIYRIVQREALFKIVKVVEITAVLIVPLTFAPLKQLFQLIVIANSFYLAIFKRYMPVLSKC